MLSMVKTDDIPPRDRFDTWRDGVSKAFVPLRCEPSAKWDLGNFSGTVHSLQLDDVQYSRISATPHVVRRTAKLIENSRDDVVKVAIQLKGECLLEQDGRSLLMSPGSIALYDTARPYSIELGPFHETLVVLIPRTRLLLPAGNNSNITARQLGNQGGASSLLATMLQTIASEYVNFDPIGGTFASNSLVELIDAAVVASSYGSSIDDKYHRAEKMILYIKRHLDDPTLGPRSIAAAHHVSIRQVHNIFRAYHGGRTTVERFIQQERLERCRRDLIAPHNRSKSIGQIGSRWGMTDAAHFSKVFRRHFGLSPRQYRSIGSRQAIGEHGFYSP